MANKSSIHVDIEKMKRLVESLKTKPSIQVGVFSGKTARSEGALTNADLALYHEVGSPQHNLPARSMLREPISDHAEQIMASVKGMEEQMVKESGPMRLWKTIGIAAEKVVLGAFATGGYGKWAPLKNSTIWRKLTGSMEKKANAFWNIKAGNVGSGILIDNGELRRSFSSRVRMRFT